MSMNNGFAAVFWRRVSDALTSEPQHVYKESGDYVGNTVHTRHHEDFNLTEILSVVCSPSAAISQT